MENMHFRTLQLEYFVFLVYTLITNAAVSSHVHNVSIRGLSLLQLYFVTERRLTAAHEKTYAKAQKWYQADQK
jgi:hypothetical protein